MTDTTDKPKLGQPRPIEEQRWRRHHTGRANLAVWPKLGVVIAASTTSGCARRRRKAIERRQAWQDGTYGVTVVEIGGDR